MLKLDSLTDQLSVISQPVNNLMVKCMSLRNDSSLLYLGEWERYIFNENLSKYDMAIMLWLH